MLASVARYRTLGNGSFFGEVALGVTTRCTASVKATSYCDVYVLDRHTWETALADYPDVAVQLCAHIKQAGYLFSPTALKLMQASWPKFVRLAHAIEAELASPAQSPSAQAGRNGVDRLVSRSQLFDFALDDDE